MPCFNNGSCLFNQTNSSFTCQCTEAFKGEYCQIGKLNKLKWYTSVIILVNVGIFQCQFENSKVIRLNIWKAIDY